MKKFTKEELDLILKKHIMWLNNEQGGERANLSSADLRYANLSSANLRYANLSSADLSSANLRYANLSSADLVIFQFNRHQALFTFDGKIRIGCHYLEVKEWAKKFKAIGEKENYSKEEINAYGVFIKLCAKLQKSHKKEKSK